MQSGTRIRSAFLGLVLTLLAAFAVAPSAHAVDTLFWVDPNESAIMRMPLDGSAAPKPLNVAPANVFGDQQFLAPGSLDYDPDTGRLYWPNSGVVPGNISWAGADGSGGGVLGNASAPIQPPLALSLDGGTDTLYVVGGLSLSVATMGLDGAQGTWALNDDNFREAILADEQGSTLWVAGPEWVAWGDLDGTGSLDTYMPSYFMNSGYSVDRDAGRLYGTWYPGPGEPSELGWMATDASTDGSITPTGVDVIMASSTAIDHDTGSIYWANATPYGEIGDTRGIFRVPLTGGTGTQIAESDVIGGLSGGLIILKVPQATGDPVLTGGTTVGSELTCGTVGWAGDRPEAHYFRSPVTAAVTWTRNGTPIEGATGGTLVADQPGTYTCARTGTNAAGTGSASSNEIVVADPTPVCPAVVIGVSVSKFSPPKPYGTKNTPGIRVTFKTSGAVTIRLQPKISYKTKRGKLDSATLRQHQFTVHGRQRTRFILPGKLKRTIVRDRGRVRFAPVTFSTRATVWQPGRPDCKQKRDLKLNTRVFYVSKRVGLRSLW